MTGPVEGHLLLGGSDMRYKKKLIGNIPTPSFDINSISISNGMKSLSISFSTGAKRCYDLS